MLNKFAFDPAAVDTDFFVEGATGDLTYGIELEANDTPDGLAHRLAFVASGSIAAAEFTVTGLDADGNVITETVDGVSDTPVETAKYFSRVDEITSDDDIDSETLDVGFVDEFVSPSIPLDWRRNVPSRWLIDQDGTVTWGVEFTIEDVALAGEQAGANWMSPESDLTDETSDSSAVVEVGAGFVAARLKVSSYSGEPSVTVYAVQPEIT